VPESVRRLYLLNPIAPLLDGLRSALLGRGEVHWVAVGGSALVGVALFAGGTLFFLYQDRRYADVI
jgi:ABC-type polysaccharide/polyol phosphate export permease